MSSPTVTESASKAAELEAAFAPPEKEQLLGNHGSQEPTPWICRPNVRLGIYTFLFLFLLLTLAWGIIPRLLDPNFEQHIQNKDVMVGMTRQQVLQAWGSPYQTNISHTSEGIRREEWIYEEWKSASDIQHRYLYFEEGILVGGWYYK